MMESLGERYEGVMFANPFDLGGRGQQTKFDPEKFKVFTVSLCNCDLTFDLAIVTITLSRGHGGRVVTLSPPTSEIGVWFSA